MVGIYSDPVENVQKLTVSQPLIWRQRRYCPSTPGKENGDLPDSENLLCPIKPGPLGQVRDHWLCLIKKRVFKSEARNAKPETISNDQN